MPSLYSLLFALSHEHSMKLSLCVCVCPLADIHLKFAERNDDWDPLLALGSAQLFAYYALGHVRFSYLFA